MSALVDAEEGDGGAAPMGTHAIMGSGKEGEKGKEHRKGTGNGN